MFEKIKSIFKKEETFSCVVFDGQKMKYLDLTQKEIDKINSDAPEYKNWSAYKKDEI